MPRRLSLVALFLSQILVAAVAFAQADAPAAHDEYGRVSGGELQLIAKHPRSLSGSFGMSFGGSSSLANGRSVGNRGYNATLGGTIVEDRLWFFASAQQSNAPLSSRYGFVQPSSVRAIDTNVNAQLGDRQNVSAAFSTGSTLVSPTAFSIPTSLPTSFLSLHYTGVISDSMFFTANVSQRNVGR